MKYNEIDKRDFSTNRASSDRKQKLQSAAEEVSKTLQGSPEIKITKMDSFSGNPAKVMVESAAVPEDAAERTNYIKRAEQSLQTLAPALGFANTQPVEFKMDSIVQNTSANTKVVHAKQTYLSKEIFQSGISVKFGPDDSSKDIDLDKIITIEQPVVDSIPKISAQDAVMITAKFLSEHPPEPQTDQFGQPLELEKINLEGFEPEIDVAIEGDPSMTTFFKPGPFAEKTKAKLLWFELKPNDLRLGWEIITTQKNSLQYRTIVDATKGISDIENEQNAILYHKLLTQFLHARMNVYTINPGVHNREMVDCPLDNLPVKPTPKPPLPQEFPDHWNDNDSKTVGNCTFAHLGTSPRVFEGTKQGDVIIFNPQEPFGDDQKVLNIFYYNCFMHDYFYILGFREADGNFQHNNFGRGGLQGDRVDSRSHSGTVDGTANMATPPDRFSPIMNMGLVASTNRHTAFDSDVVYHEFMHGVTNRLVGGPVNTDALEEPQSGMMGEGWGDYIACIINEKTIVGDWVVKNQRGIRNNKYDSNFPHNFGNLGGFVNGIDYTEVHNGGEIWCATLLETNRNINNDNLSVQLVVDALKLSPTNPSFLDMRDSILEALDDKLESNQISKDEYTQIKKGIWKAFAKFGMGPNASSNGSQLNGIVPDFNMPS